MFEFLFCELCVYPDMDLYQITDLQIFPPSPQLIFSFFLDAFQKTEVLNFGEIQFNIFSSVDGAFGATSKKTWFDPRSQRFSPAFSFRSLEL